MKNAMLPKRWRGIALMLVNLYWIYHNFQLFHLYHSSTILFVVKIPESLLLLNMLLGIGGVFIGIGVYKDLLEASKWLLIGSGFIIFGLLLEGFAIA